MNRLSSRDIIYLIIMLVILFGVFALLIMNIDIPQWLIGVVGASLTGVVGIRVGNNDYE